MRVRSLVTLGTGAALGAGAMYLLDPDHGPARRRDARRTALREARRGVVRAAVRTATRAEEAATAAVTGYVEARATARSDGGPSALDASGTASRGAAVRPSAP